jgi:hypothetical protein
MSLPTESIAANAPMDLHSIMSNPANLSFFNNLMDERIKAKEEERRRDCRTGTSIDASGLQSTDSPLTFSSQSSNCYSVDSNSSANDYNAALQNNKNHLVTWSDKTLRDVYSIINKPDRYALIAESKKIVELIEIR